MGIEGRIGTSLAVAAWAAALGVACAAPDDGGGAVSREAHTERFAVIALVYEEGDEVPVHDLLSAQAYFVEHAGVTRAAVLRLLNSPLDGLADPVVALDSCVVEQRDLVATGPDEAAASVRLLDVGELMLETPGDAAMFDSHYFPEMYPAVSGLQYDGVLRDSRAFAFGRPLTVFADGSDEVGDFSVALTPPPVVHLHSVGGERPPRAHRWTPDAAGLEVSWAAPAGVAADEVAILQYVRHGFDRLVRVTCAVADDGAFTVPEAALSALPDLGPDQTERLVLERVRALDFAAPGLADGLVVAIARDTVVLD